MSLEAKKPRITRHRGAWLCTKELDDNLTVRGEGQSPRQAWLALSELLRQHFWYSQRSRADAAA